jgi:hypothetical protein
LLSTKDSCSYNSVAALACVRVVVVLLYNKFVTWCTSTLAFFKLWCELFIHWFWNHPEFIIVSLSLSLIVFKVLS